MFLVAAVATALWGLVVVVRRLRQAASQRTAAAVAKRARRGRLPKATSNVHPQANDVYGYAHQIPAGETLASVKLPSNSSNVGILGTSVL